MAKNRGNEDDTLENKFIEGELDGNASNFVDDEDDDNTIDESGEIKFVDDDDSANFKDDDDDLDDEDDLDGDDDDEDEDDEDDDDEDKDDDAEGAAKDGEGAEGDAGSDNEWELRGQLWKENGRLPADLEIPKGITQIDLEDLYMKQVEKNVEARFQAKYSDILQAKGVDPNAVFGEQASYDEIALKQYQFVSSLSYDSFVQKSKDIPGDLRAIAETYHLSRNENLTEEELADLIASEMKKNTEEELFDKYHTFFTEESKKLESKIQNDKATAAKNATEKATKDANYIKEKLSKMGLKDDDAKKVLDGMFVQNQIYDNGRGYRKRVTMLEKIRLESADSIDQQLDMAVNLILKPDPKMQKEKNERVGRLTTLQELAKIDSTTNGKSNSRNKKTTNKGKIMAPKSQFLAD